MLCVGRPRWGWGAASGAPPPPLSRGRAFPRRPAARRRRAAPTAPDSRPPRAPLPQAARRPCGARAACGARCAARGRSHFSGRSPNFRDAFMARRVAPLHNLLCLRPSWATFPELVSPAASGAGLGCGLRVFASSRPWGPGREQRPRGGWRASLQQPSRLLVPGARCRRAGRAPRKVKHTCRREVPAVLGCRQHVQRGPRVYGKHNGESTLYLQILLC